MNRQPFSKLIDTGMGSALVSRYGRWSVAETPTRDSHAALGVHFRLPARRFSKWHSSCSSQPQMWRILSLLIVPISMMAQTPSLSLLSVEEDAGRHVLQLRNLYSAAVTCYVIGYEPSGIEPRRRNQWDLLLQPNAEASPLEPGATRVFDPASISGENQHPEAWKPLAVVYADGTYAGDADIIQSILDDRRTVALQIQKGLDILSAGGNVQPEVDRWFEETRNGKPSVPFGARRGYLLSIFEVSGYVRRELKRGITPGEIVQELKSWQARLQQYQLSVAFV
jgi:hypothetical protein